jgi:hypothetical protein
MVKRSSLTVAMVMEAISDAKSLYILSRVASAEVDSQLLLSEKKLTPKSILLSHA